MNDDRRVADSKEDSASERALERLFEHAKPRFAPPAADAEEIRRAVYAEWDAATGGRRRWQRAGYAAAASVLLALGWWVGFAPNPSGPPVAVANVERVDGRVNETDGAPLVVGDTMAAGSIVVTGTGQVALRLVTGGSLRIGSQSRVELTDADGARLLAGRLYFDSENRRSGAEFTVATDLGDVRDVGTQFVARLDEAAGRLDVGVRDGPVAASGSS
jgi:ferric-dicitrate binding protein FerR (iron transport regulator)